MEIKENRVAFTPDEAHWVQKISAQSHTDLIDVAQRVLDARLQFASPEFKLHEPFQYKNNLPAAQNVLARFALNSQMDTLHRTTVEQAALKGMSDHVISIEMSDNEKLKLFKATIVEYSTARDRKDVPELVAVEHNAQMDDVTLFLATSDVVPANKAVEIIDVLRDPAFDAAANEHRDEVIGDLPVITGVLAVLKAHLREPRREQQQ